MNKVPTMQQVGGEIYCSPGTSGKWEWELLGNGHRTVSPATARLYSGNAALTYFHPANGPPPYQQLPPNWEPHPIKILIPSISI